MTPPDVHAPGIRSAVESLVAPLAGTGAADVVAGRGAARPSGPTERRLPRALDEAVARLEASAWPEVAGSWSRLTPSGFPVEVTVLPDRTWQWSAEVAGPELPEPARLDRALRLLDRTGSPLPSATRQALVSHQAGRDLRFGAWIAGRGDRLKVYTELTAEPTAPGQAVPRGGRAASGPSGTSPAAAACHPGGRLSALPPGLPLPERVASGLARLPYGTIPRMLGAEPARQRTELYFRLTADGLGDLLPFLRATGHAEALRGLEESLPDGVRRLSGRRLGLSVAWAAEGPLELALFVSARTLFPAHPQGLLELAPYLTGLSARPCLVTLVLDPAGRAVSTRASVCPWPDGGRSRNGS
ncbi:hypothetical protein [Streptomyces sp. NPDC050504]|uniref:hypothetical protein n=1 Tax=Streptomyces sp. NPDC050504 TaxID=3365618 RepID=UPI00379409D9